MLHGLVDDSDWFSHAKIASNGNFYLLLEKTTNILQVLISIPVYQEIYAL